MNSLSAAVRIRRMTPADLDRVLDIAASQKQAPQWPRSAYLAALDSMAAPPRIALVAEVPETGTGAPADRSSSMETETEVPADLGTPASDFDSLGWRDRSSSPGQGVVAGFIVASLLPPQAELEIIAVAPQLQRRGLARRLFTALAAELRSALAAELRTGQLIDLLLELRASNLPALAFYRSLGFTEAGRRPRYYHDPIEDALLMRLRLG
jgi:ribosomal-protein-alanine N-acetyltransferase